MFTRFVARRHLLSPKARTVINFVSGLSVVSVAVPVAAMVILLSVFNGFEHLVRQLSSVFEADVTVTPAEGRYFAVADLPSERIRETEGVAAVSFYAEQNVLAENGDKQSTTILRGIDDDFASVTPIEQAVEKGESNVRLGDIDRILAGRGAAYALGIYHPSDKDITLYALRSGHMPSLLPVGGYVVETLPLCGLFALDAETDSKYMLTTLRKAQELFGIGSAASALAVKCDAGSDPSTVAARIRGIAGEKFEVQTREERNTSLYAVMRYEKWGIFIISLLVLVVASFATIGAIVMLIVEKRGDMFTLRALGADTKALRRIFVTEGMMICSAGAVAGLAAGIALCLLQQHLGIIRIPVETMLVEAYPVRLAASDVAIIIAAQTAVSWAICRTTVGAMIKPTTL